MVPIACPPRMVPDRKQTRRLVPPVPGHQQRMLRSDTHPDIHCSAVRLPQYHFGCDVGESSGDSPLAAVSADSPKNLPILCRRVYAPTKVAYLDLAVHAKQQIFRFDVPMYHILRVQIRQSISDLSDVLLSAAILPKSPTRLLRRSENRPAAMRCLNTSP